MEVVVTGGCGFIGRHVVKLLSEKGVGVLVVDNLSTSSEHVARELEKKTGAKVLIGSAHILNTLPADYDAVIHLGQPSSSPLYWKYSELFSRTVEEMQAVLEYAVKASCPVIYASSSSVYAGNPVPWSEDMKIIPWDRYSEVKYICERMGTLYALRQRIRFIALRFFSVYGEGEEYKGNFANLFTQLIWSALTHKALEVYHGGRQTRDLVYVGDVAEAVYSALRLALESHDGFHEVINVGSGREVPVREMIEIIRSKTGLEPRVKLMEYAPSFYIHRTLADTRKAESLLGWTAKTTPEDAVEEITRYYFAITEKVNSLWHAPREALEVEKEPQL
ncbi:MAG: NAD-dependent epimerase/dehydratase family protein [Thermofilaceae archaeon]